MSKYTTEVRFICESLSGLAESKGNASINEIISMSREKIFDFNFPIYDENYRSVLETKIIRHFYTREIGAESVGLWKMWLETRMNEIMPYYNQLYESTLIKFNPIVDTVIVTNRTGNKRDNGSVEENINRDSSGSVGVIENNSSEDWNYYSDTPQGGVDGIITMKYLTSATHDSVNNINKGDTTTSGNEETSRNYESENRTTEDYIEKISGKRSGISYSKMLEEFRNTFLNIDMMVINELNDLFMNLW